jgi:hypothetical protein
VPLELNPIEMAIHGDFSSAGKKDLAGKMLVKIMSYSKV